MRVARGGIWRSGAATAALVAMLPTPAAWADADAHFKAGVAALEEGRHAEALRKADDS